MAKKIELSTGPKDTPSERWLTATQLVVHWDGGISKLFYRMTKGELCRVLNGAESANTKETFNERTRAKSFAVNLTKTTLSIGCERFNASDLKLMKKWCAR